MTSQAQADLILFGGTGDLARRKLLPALYHLFAEGDLPADFRLTGVARNAPDGESYADLVAASLSEHVEPDFHDPKTAKAFIARTSFVAADIDAPGGLDSLSAALSGRPDAARYFYLATPPGLYGRICTRLAEAGLNENGASVALEKPIGDSLETARAINEAVAAAFPENRTFRIDHYLGKATVQNLLALRFGNSILEPIWNNRAIDHVQITVAEQIGVEMRRDYYDSIGALRDMVQNHILQLLCLIAMEAPASLTGRAVRDEKLKVLRSLKPVTSETVRGATVRGQYVAGRVEGESAPGYSEDDDNGRDTETFAALRADIQNWRWAGVPFYLRTGKRMQTRFSEIVIQFKDVPHSAFKDSWAGALAPNSLTIRLQPEENIQLTLMNSFAGVSLERTELAPVTLDLAQSGAAPRRRIAYERLIYDWMRGDPTLFVGREEVEEAWRWIDGVIEGWSAAGQMPELYRAGSWGPQAADDLLNKTGVRWRNPEV